MSALLVRETTTADAAAVARLQVRSWRAAYAGLIPAGYLAAMSAAERATRYTRMLAEMPAERGHWVAEAAGVVQGFAGAGRSRDEGAGREVGELYALYVDPDYWGRGAGRALLDRAGEFLVNSGCTEMTLWVLAGNRAARGFYEAAGFHHDGTSAELDIGAGVPEVRYRRPIGPAVTLWPG
ncbi:MAG: GNAT family N-acetyltransferase [Mycobacteriales bacterium]